MAKLTTCGTCGHQVSSTATQCPNCGQKFKKKTSIFTWALAGLIGIPFLFGIFKSANNSPPQVAEQPIQQQVDPSYEDDSHLLCLMQAISLNARIALDMMQSITAK